MGLLDKMAALPPNSLGGTNKSFIDADTLQDDEGNRFRLQGVDAAEVEKVTNGRYRQGTAGGEATTEIISNLANEQGFTNLVPQFDENGEPVRDPFGRIISDLTNDAGESFRSKLLEAGAFDINKYTTQEDIAARDIAEARRNRDTVSGNYTLNAFDTAATMIEDAELAEGAKTLGFKHTAVNEAELAAANAAGLGHLYTQYNVDIRNRGRTITNESLNPFTDSWNQSLINVGSSAANVLNLIGERSGNESLANWGADMAARAEANLADFGTTIIDYKDVTARDANGDLKVWDTLGNTWEFLGNNFIMSLPYMGASIVGAGGLAVGGLASAAILAPVALYTGDVWGEMEGENKSASLAVAAGVTQTVLDKFGLGFIFKSGVASKDVMKKAVKALAKKDGISTEAAEQLLLKATRKEIGNLAGSVEQVAKNQLRAKTIAMDILKRGSVAAVGEAGTEAAQEATGYLAAVLGSDKEFNWEELNERLVSAAVAGSALGGTLAVPGGVSNAAAWADIYHKGSIETESTASDAERYAEEAKAREGRLTSHEEIAADARARWLKNPGATINDRTEANEARKAKKSTLDRTTEALSNVASLWQGATRNVFHPDLLARSATARKMAGMYGGLLQRIHPGSNFENSKHHSVSTYKNMVPDPIKFFRRFGNRTSQRFKNQISQDLYATFNAALDKDGVLDIDKIPADIKNREAVIEFGKQMQDLAKRMYLDQKKYNPELGHIGGYLFKVKGLDKRAVEKNQGKFSSLLQEQYQMSSVEAKKLVDAIVHNQEVNDIDEAFSVVKGGIVPSAHKKRSLGLSENAKFQEFLEQDIFANISSAVKSAARFTAHREFIGEDGAVINRLLDDMQAEGVPEEEVDKIAAQMKDYFDAESGNYKRPQTETGKKLQAIQRSFMTFTTLASLPLSTISSFVEAALVSQGLRKDQIFGEKGSLKSMGGELAGTIAAGIKNVAGLRPGGYTDHQVESEARTRIRDLGYYDWDVGAATTTGVTETANWSKTLMPLFFKWNGLQGWTNSTRAMRASIAGDYMFDKTKVIADWAMSGEPRNREVQEAQEALRNLGVDVDPFVELSQRAAANLPLSEEQEAAMANMTREATFNFVNNAVALPQSANRPLIYQDPRFALFTQFQGFIATFTANHIPKLWGEYVKRGTPAMKYNAFATMATMIMLGFASQALKDVLKYGYDSEDDETFHNPYLDTPEYLQRGVRASGLLGTGERLLDWAFPLYETRSRNVGDWAWNAVAGESPAIGYAERLARGTGRIAEGEVQSGVDQLIRAVPGFGPFPDVTQRFSDYIKKGSWNPRGG